MSSPTGGRPSPSSSAANERDRGSLGRWPEGTTALTLMAREGGRCDQPAQAGRLAQARQGGHTRRARRPAPAPAGAATRRGWPSLAGWSTGESPTTARAFVNRVWQSYFGTGLVRTSEDLGTQGERPSHPELLDWLACEFMDGGWSVKALHRLIVGSAAYRQSARVTPELHARDPDNRLLARGPRFRVEAEIVRDIALASSGLLNPTAGRAQPLCPRPRLPVPAARELCPLPLEGGVRAGSLPARHLHLPQAVDALSRRWRPSMPPTAIPRASAACGRTRRCRR